MAMRQEHVMTDKESIDIQALAVACDILDAIQRSQTRVSAAQIARELGMTPPRAGRYLNSMQSLGLIDTLPGERGYSLGWKLIQLGQSAIDKMHLSEIALAEAEQLRNSLQDSVYVAVPRLSGASVIIFLRGRSPVALHIPLGMFYEGHASASGRVIMAFAEPEQREQLLQRPLDAAAFPEPIVDRAALEARYALIRQRMYDVAYSVVRHQGASQQFVTGIAAPLFSLRNRIAGSIGIMSGFAGPDDLQSSDIVTKLCQSAENISRALGGTYWEGWAQKVVARKP